ncbi:MAG: hypothetical protein ACJ79S_08605 [Gemmatimonadaceae bacterium]
MLPWLAAAAAGAVAGLVQYGARQGGRAGPGGRGRVVLPALLRAAAVALLIALLLDAPAGPRRAVRPFAALDVSASWRRTGDPAAYAAGVRALRDAGADSTFVIGDSVRPGTPPAAPEDRASRVRPAVERALAAGRPLTLVTDGEVDDPDALGELPAGSLVRVVSPAERPDVAVASIEAPRATVRGDTIEVRVALAAGARGAPAGRVAVAVGGRPLASLPFEALQAYGERTLTARVPVTTPDGTTLLSAVAAAAGDAEARNDTLATALEVAPAAGAVFVSTSPDQDARFAIAVLRGALALPTRGYLRVAPGAWRLEGTLAPVTEGEVRAAVRDAPLVVLHGDTAVFGPPRQAPGRGALALIAPPRASDGDWYAVAAPASPIAPALAGLAWDSLPPIDVSATPPRGEWEGLETRRGRRFDRRVAVAGSERPRRVVTVAAAGFWRWRFRGGQSADAFAALWGSIFDWLAAERGDVRAALPVEGIVRAGEAVRWRRGSGSDSVVVALLTRRGAAPARVDSVTLDFGGGTSVAESAPLAPGVYDVRVSGGSAVLVVNPSREWLPRRPSVRAGAVGSAAAAAGGGGVRTVGWLYGILLASLCGEWVLRRRAGMR